MLNLEQLEGRYNLSNQIVGLDPAIDLSRFPAELVPGWNGGIQVSLGDVNGDHIVDVIAAAQDGGSAHIVVYDGATANLLGSFIAFSPDFRGGGRAVVTNSPQYPATLLVVPGPGGGPVVQEYRFLNGGMQIVNSELLPYPDEFRGGLYINTGPFHNLGDPPDAFFLPGAGGGPEFVAMNLETGAIDADFWAGDPTDMTGNYQFAPDTGSVQLGSLGVKNDLGIPIQYGNVPDATNHIPTVVWDFATGQPVVPLSSLN